MMLVDGDAVLEEKLSNPRKVVGRPIVTSVLVVPKRPADLVVALGDSISDGVRDKPSEPHGWVSYHSGATRRGQEVQIDGDCHRRNWRQQGSSQRMGAICAGQG